MVFCERIISPFFISNDLTHVSFVELCNSMIHTYYDERDINIEIDIEFNDGCANASAFFYLPKKNIESY